MKNESVIRQEISRLNEDLKQVESEFNNLDQISMQGKRGSDLSTQIDRIKGKIVALKWVL